MDAGYNDAVCRYVAIYLNPLLSLSQLVTCLNRDVVPHLVIYWLIPISAVLLVGGCTCNGSCDATGCPLIDRPKHRQTPEDKVKDKNTDSQYSVQSGSKNRVKSAEKNVKKNGEKIGANNQHSHHSMQEQDCQEEDQNPGEEKTKKKAKHHHHHHHEKNGVKKEPENGHDNEPEYVENDPQNGNVSNQRSHSDSRLEEDYRQIGKVVCGEECTERGMHWQCRLHQSQGNDEENRSGNAKDASYDCPIESVVQAYRLSRQLKSTSGVRFEDEPGLLNVSETDMARLSTSSDIHCRSRTASHERKRRRQNDDRKESKTTKSSTKQRTTTGDNSYEDRCAEYYDSDEGDEQ